MDEIRYGFIGAGAMARGHLGAISSIDGLRVVAAADTSEDSLGKFKADNPDDSTAYCSDYRNLLSRDDIDAVLVVTPDFTHVDIVLDCLAAGKHVLSEKPPATTRDDLDRLAAAVDSSGKTYMLGFECRQLPIFKRLRGLLDADDIGTPRMIWCREFREPFYEKVDNWILFNDKTGGIFVEKTCHFFDLFNWFAGADPVRVVAMAGLDVVKELYGVKPDVFDNGWVMVEYANGLRACLGLCMFCHKSPDLEMDILGDKGRLESFLEAGRIDLWRYEGDDEKIDCRPPEDIEKLSHKGGVYYEHLEFADCVRTGRRPATGLREGRMSTLIGLAAEESARSGSVPVDI